jgi:WD40 repeat protein
MKKLMYFYSIICTLFISQITFSQTATFYHYIWSPDGSRLVVVIQNDNTYIATLYDDQWQPLASRQIPSISLHFSPDGDSLLLSGAGVPAEILDIDTLQTIRVLPAGIIWSPDGSELASFESGPPEVMKIYSAADGRLLREFTDSIAAAWGWPYELLWSPNGAYFVTAIGSQLAILDAITGQQVGANYQLDGIIISYKWSSDSTRIAISLIKQVPEGTVGSFPAAGTSPDKYELNTIDVVEISTGITTILRSGFRYPAYPLLWSPDDTQITTILDGNLHILDSANGNVMDRFTLLPNFTLISYSPDGGRLLTGLANNIPPYVVAPVDSAMDLSMPLSEFRQTALDGMVEIFAPAASPERLQSILSACSSDGRLQRTAETLIDAGQYQEFITRLDANTSVPAACAADLRLMAQALASDAVSAP